MSLPVTEHNAEAATTPPYLGPVSTSEHSPHYVDCPDGHFGDVDQAADRDELIRRWNGYPVLLKALLDLLEAGRSADHSYTSAWIEAHKVIQAIGFADLPYARDHLERIAAANDAAAGAG